MMVFLTGVFTNSDAAIDVSARGRVSSALSKSLAHYTMGIIYDNEGRHTDAAGEYRAAISLEPEISCIHTRLAVEHILADDYKTARTEFETAESLDPNEPAVHFYLGALHEKLKEYDPAVKELKEAIRLDPDFADAYNYLGYMIVESGENLDGAVALIRRALDIEPDNFAYIDSLGWAYFKKGMYKEALAELEKAVGLEPDDPDVKEHLKAIREKLKK